MTVDSSIGGNNNNNNNNNNNDKIKNNYSMEDGVQESESKMSLDTTNYNSKQAAKAEVVEFEEAIALTGYGKFNYMLLLCMLPASVTTLFGTTGISFIIPAAKCDLHMSVYQVGLLNGAIYVGMVSSAFLWGFLSDTLGRKNLLFIGLLLNGMMELTGGLVQTYWLLFIAKFLSGFATCGPYALLYTYLSEFVDKKHRDQTVMRAGTLTASGFIMQPIVAYLIIPNRWTWVIPGTDLVLNNWRLFLIISSVPSLSAACLVGFLSETPKFLVSRGRIPEALQVLQTMYSINTGKPPQTYPVKRVYINENGLGKSPQFSMSYQKDECGCFAYLRSGWKQVRPLFQQPYLVPALITFFAQCITMLTQNSIRLLLPNLFAFMIGDGNQDKSLSLCEIWDQRQNDTKSAMCDGTEVAVSSEVYLYSIIAGTMTFISFFLSTPLVKTFGKTLVFCGFHFTSAICIMLYPWSHSTIALILASTYVSIMQNSVSIAIGVIVQRVPTSLRAMTVSMVMMTGRMGVIAGNLFMPISLSHTCLGSFIFIGCLNLLCAPVLLLLPKSDEASPRRF